MNAKRNSCQGFCCAAFNLPVSPSALARLSGRRFRDIEKIKDMVIPLGKHKGNPVVEQANVGNSRVHFYTCKFFDGESRNCLDYENRPTMCRDFPYSLKTCPYEGCRHYNGRMLRQLRVIPETASKEKSCLVTKS